MRGHSWLIVVLVSNFQIDCTVTSLVVRFGDRISSVNLGHVVLVQCESLARASSQSGTRDDPASNSDIGLKYDGRGDDTGPRSRRQNFCNARRE